MSQDKYKPTNCKNCGGYSHCGSPYWRDEKDYNGEYHQIEVCKSCRCDTCIEPSPKNNQ